MGRGGNAGFHFLTCAHGRTDGLTDQRTDKGSYRCVSATKNITRLTLQRKKVALFLWEEAKTMSFTPQDRPKIGGDTVRWEQSKIVEIYTN